jgi:hypothetical protein
MILCNHVGGGGSTPNDRQNVTKHHHILHTTTPWTSNDTLFLCVRMVSNSDCCDDVWCSGRLVGQRTDDNDERDRKKRERGKANLCVCLTKIRRVSTYVGSTIIYRTSACFPSRLHLSLFKTMIT